MNLPTPRDELASAYLDGEATPDERAAVEADATLLARVDELRAVRRSLAVPVPARAAAAVDSAIAAALAADVRSEGPVYIGPRRQRGRTRVALAVLGAAAAAAVVVGVVTLRPSDNSVPSASRTAETAAVSEPTAGAAVAPGATIAGAATTIAAAAPRVATTAAASAVAAATTAASGSSRPALGAIADADGLRSALASIPADLSAASASASDHACAVPDAILAATAIWQGTPADVFVDHSKTAHVVSQATCAALATVPLS